MNKNFELNDTISQILMSVPQQLTTVMVLLTVTIMMDHSPVSVGLTTKETVFLVSPLVSELVLRLITINYN